MYRRTDGGGETMAGELLFTVYIEREVIHSKLRGIVLARKTGRFILLIRS